VGLARGGGAAVLLAGQAEVAEFRHSAAGEHDVAGLDVAMDEADAVRVAEGVGDVPHDIQRQGLVERALAHDHLVDGFAVHVFHGEVVEAVAFAGLEALDDVAVVQAADGLRLPDEPPDVFLVPGEPRRKDLDRHEAVHAELAGLIDDAHAAAADLAEEFVASESPGPGPAGLRGVLCQGRSFPIRGASPRASAAAGGLAEAPEHGVQFVGHLAGGGTALEALLFAAGHDQPGEALGDVGVEFSRWYMVAPKL